MAETEVESILREIRERVLSQQGASQDAARKSARVAMTNGGNGAGDPAIGDVQNRGTLAAQSLALIDSYLTTTARTWDRLPPVVSNRSGVSARLELWLKRQLKAATRWFTWEQVNFNAAVHHALRDLLPLLSAYEQELGKLRAQSDAEAEARRSGLVELRSELVSELRERDEHLHDEQRVCYKQLALETSEAAVLEDRARRKTEALLAELQQRIEQLEKFSEQNPDR